MSYLKVIQKITPIEISVSENSDQKTYPKKFRGGGFSPLSPPWIRLCCSMIMVKNNKRAMFDCCCTLLSIHCIVISMQWNCVSINYYV